MNWRTASVLNKLYAHKVVNHAVQYVHANGMENFWSLLKRPLGGRTGVPGSTSDSGRTGIASAALWLASSGKRITYRKLTGKDHQPATAIP